MSAEVPLPVGHEIPLQLVGWPQWPPEKGDLPPYAEWWKSKRVHLPSGPHLENAVLVTINGSAQSGKSTLLNEISQQIKNESSLGDWDVVIYDELTTSHPELVVTARPLLGNFEDDYRLSIDRKDDWIASVFLQIEKTLWWQSLIDHYIDFPPEKKTLIIGFRGPVDIMIWQYALAAHRGDPNFEVPDEFRDLVRDSGTSLARAQSLANKIDATIQIGISQQQARARRKLAGKVKQGWVTDSPIYNDLHSWTNYWLENVYPKSQKLHDLGLAVVNGENTAQQIRDDVSSFILDVVRRVGPR